VGRVPVLDAEFGGEFADFVVDMFGDFVGDFIEEVEDGVVAGGGAVCVEKSLAEERGVELWGLVYGGCWVDWGAAHTVMRW
jgi:hypothetical protein